VLVTGGAGFIGSHFCERLLKEGHEVITIDNLSQGKRENIPKGVEFIKEDIEEMLSLPKNIEIVYHLAAAIGVQRMIENPRLFIDTNIKGTENILELSCYSKIKKFVFVSSSAVYGNTELPTQKETDPLIAYDIYGLTKIAGEYYTKTYCDNYKIPYSIIRPFNVYGPRQDCSPYGAVISIWLDRILNEQYPVVYGDGTQTRDFTNVDDIVELLIRVGKIGFGDRTIFNAGCGSQISINELCVRILRECNSDLKAKFEPLRREEVHDRKANMDRARELLNFTPKVPLEIGLKRLVEWKQKQLAN
jgi:UDP-glucose 4-epimerase